MNRMEDSLSHLGCKLGLETPAYVSRRELTDMERTWGVKEKSKVPGIQWRYLVSTTKTQGRIR